MISIKEDDEMRAISFCISFCVVIISIFAMFVCKYSSNWQLQTTQYTERRISNLISVNKGLTEKGITSSVIKVPYFVGVRLKNVDFSNTIFGDGRCQTNFSGAFIEDSRFVNAKMNGAVIHAVPSCDARELFVSAKFRHCDFTNASIRNASFNGCVITECNFNGADFTGADIGGPMMAVDGEEYALLTRIDKCTMVGAKFNKCGQIRIHNSNLKNADLSESQVQTYDCDLQGANVCSVDLNLVVIRDDIDAKVRALQGVKYDDKTIWPMGVTPKECNAVLYKLTEPSSN